MKARARKMVETVMLAAMIILCLSQSGCARNQVASIADLTVGFLSPPESAKPLTWWHWMNGNVTKEGITLDLEKMKEVGVAGFQIFDVGQGIPQGPVDYLSPEWLEMMQWAATEADRLGLEYDMHNCPGWSSTGGPWVTPEWAMQNLVWSETTVTGGTLVDVTLAQPYTNLDYYRDAFVLAFPAPGTDTQPVRATSSSGPVDLGLLAGGDPGGVEIRPMDETDPERPGYLQLEYAAPIDVRTITLGGVSLAQPGAGGRAAPGAGRGGSGDADQIRLEVSDDGVTFRSITTITGAGGRGRLGGGTTRPSTTSFPVVTARYFRLVIPRATRITELRLSSAATISDWQTKSNAAGGRRGGAAPEAAETGAPGIDPESIVDISRYMDGGGRLNWQAPAGNWTIIRFGYTPTGTQNRAGSSTGTGLEIDKYSRDAVDFHWNINIKPVLSAMAPIARKGLAGIVVDSYEAGTQNWTARFPEEFQKRCGYDLRAYLPAMTGKVVGNIDISDRFLWDVRRTMADLMVDNYYAYIAELAHKNRLKFYVEPYHTAMFDETQVGYTADVVMGEFWQGQGLHASIKLVSSVGHVGGIRVVGAESFTSRSRWTEYPYSLKVLGDWMYTMGLNRYIFHRHAMQPHPDAVPGMTMGPWGGHFDRTNTWWNQNAAAWLEYVARCQYLLQQGLFVGDLLYYTGEDAPLSVESGREQLGVPQGYDYDVAGKEAILTRLRVRDGRIVLPDGMSYRLLVLPEKTTMTVEVARRLRDLVRDGMWMIGPRPEHTPTLIDYPDSDTELRRIADEVWGDLDGRTVTERSFGRGRVFWGQSAQAVLDRLNTKPDFESTSRSGDAQINFIHRRVGDAEVYFLANSGYQSEDLVCTFRVNGKQPEFWKADTGEMIPASSYERVDGRTRVPIQLDPAGSVFVVFRPEAPAGGIVVVSRDGTTLVSTDPFPVKAEPAEVVAPARGGGGGFGSTQTAGQEIPTALEELPVLNLATASGAKGGLLFWQNGTYSLRDNAGRTSSVQISGIGRPVELAGPWRLTFPPDLGAPSQVILSDLISWPEHSDDGVKHFSGTATYSKQINVAADALANGKRLFLDLGRVMVLAEVFVNGENLGVLWKAPYRVDITDAVRTGSNDLEIRVTNLWPNRLIGDEQLPDDYQYGGGGGREGGAGLGGITETPRWYVTNQPRPESERVAFTMYKYYTKDSPLLESGLIGPVKLITAIQLSDIL